MEKARPVNLALQGGGAHGAFTWGVLDRLLEEPGLEIEAISGTSAGAMNAVVVADGLMKGGREEARRGLRDFWSAVSRAALWSPVRSTPLDRFRGSYNLDHSPGYLFFDLLSRTLSPYQLNPCNANPLRDILADQVDFERVRRCDRIKLFISATSVQTGRIKVFRHDELCPEALMASACLPHLFQSVEIDGESYWDGGYMGNPALFPFAYRCTSPDVVIVRINPMGCVETPRTAREILNRANEITFNSSLLHELRAIEFVGRLLDEGCVDPARYKKMLVHVIDAEQDLKPFNASSKFNASREFLNRLQEVGRSAADAWLRDHKEKLGVESTVDLRSFVG